MYVQPRPEPAPAMRSVNCSSINELKNLLSKPQTLAHLSTLSIRNDEESESYRQSDIICQAARRFAAGKVRIPSLLLQLRSPCPKVISSMDPEESGYVPWQDDLRQSAAVEVVAGVGIVPLRTLEIAACVLGNHEMSALWSLILGHSTLNILRLRSSRLLPTSDGFLKRLAQAGRMSNLRILELTNNPIGSRSVIELIDNLYMPGLIELTLSVTMQQNNLAQDQQSNPLWYEDPDQSWREEDPKIVWKTEMRQVAMSVAKLISSSGEEPKGYAPRLEKLKLNGNDLGWMPIKHMVRSVLAGNNSLVQVELFSTMEDDDSDDEDDNDNRHVTTSSNHSSAIRRVESIGSIHYNYRRSLRTDVGSGNASPGRDDAQASGFPSEDVYQRFQRQLQRQETQRVFEPLTKANWRFRLGRHLWQNRVHILAVKDASRHILPIVRLLSCKCREGDSKNGSFPFARLPSEIRSRIVHLLDSNNVLSLQQKERITSFASNPATIGYGCKSSNFGLSDLAWRQVEQEISLSSRSEADVHPKCNDDYGLLPHHFWRWRETIRDYTMPRDWPALMLDEGYSRRSGRDASAEENEDGIGGGGGPDGQGGLTFSRKGPDRLRRAWLDQQSGLQAFWEATGTYRMEDYTLSMPSYAPSITSPVSMPN